MVRAVPNAQTFHRSHTAATCQLAALADNSLSVVQLPPQVKTWYVQYLMRRQMPGVRSDQDKIPFFKALMSGEVSVEWTHAFRRCDMFKGVKKRGRSGSSSSEQDKVPFFKALMSGEVSATI
jgi:hypothetical protein